MKRPDNPADLSIASGSAVNHTDLHQFSNGASLSVRQNSSSGISDPERALSLMIQRLLELPPVTKKLLAMYYYENAQLSEIAVCLNLPESLVWEMHRETIASLRSYILAAPA